MITRNNRFQNKDYTHGNSALRETIIYNPVVEGFGIINTPIGEEYRIVQAENMDAKASLLSLPCEVLYSIFVNLDSFR